jgi:hypothetical protein
MPMDAGVLQSAIADVCPVLSVTVVDPVTRGSWSYVADPSATQAQKDAADNVIATIPIDPLPAIGPSEFINRFTDAEYLLLKQKQQTDFTANDISLTKIWDIVIGANVLDMNSSDAQTLKSRLVTDGVLTQARADEIFSGPLGKKRRFA